MSSETRPKFRLTAEQHQLLLQPLHGSRVGKNPKGFSHLEAWDIRRWLIRVFGFGGYKIENVIELVKEIESPPGSIKYRNGGSNDKTVWTAVYRAEVRLTVFDQYGGEAVFEDVACGDSSNQPSVGDCHDNAVKTAASQGLKRCAVNLGDQFGLGLYNDGGLDAVVVRTVVGPLVAESAPAPMAVEDAPVRPEPGTEPTPGEELPVRPVSAPPAPAVPAPVPATEDAPPPRRERPTEKVGQDQHRTMHALWKDLGYGGPENREARLAITAKILAQPDLDSSADLTRDQAQTVIAALKDRQRQMRQQQRGAAA